MAFNLNERLTIATGKHKGKSATVMEVGETQICCWVDKEFYMWYYPEDLKKEDNAVFSFPEKEAIAQQIAELKQRLTKYEDCETNAEQLKDQVGSQAQLMVEMGVTQDQIVAWANRLYFLATGIDLRKISLPSYSASMQEVEELKQERDRLKLKVQELESLTDDMDAQLAEQQLMPASEALGQEVEELKQERDRLSNQLESSKTDNRAFLTRIQELEAQLLLHKTAQETTEVMERTSEFKVGDRVVTEEGEGEITGFAYGNALVQVEGRLPIQFQLIKLTKIPEFEKGDIVQHSEGKVGTVSYIPSPFKGILSVKMPDGEHNYHAVNLKLVSRNSQSEAQRRGQEFIAGIKKSSDLEAIAWTQIQEICQGDIVVLKEIGLGARTKIQKELVACLPKLLVSHIEVTGDRSDLDWVGQTLRSKVEEFLKPVEAAAS